MTPRIELNLPNDDYHAMPQLSSTQIKDALRTPAHFYAKHRAVDKKSHAPTATMLLGTVVHTLVLESDKFDSEYAISQKFDKRTKQGKLDAELFSSINAHKTVIDDAIYTQAQSMANSILRHPVARLLKLPSMIPEASIFYTDTETGLDCRIRPDYHLPPCEQFPHGLIVDLKTTDNASYGAFNRTIINFGYHISAAMYCDGFMQMYGTDEPPPFLWLIGERDAPYAVICYQPNAETMAKGLADKNEALSIIADCENTGDWYGYPSDILDINLPMWALNKD